MLHHPCILGGHQRHGGQNETWWGPQVSGNATSPLHSRGSPKTWRTKSELVGPTSGRKCYITPAFSRIPQRRGEQNQNWWGPQVVGNATSPLHFRGSPKTWWTKSELVGPTSGQKCYITPAFSGIPKDMWDKMRLGGAHKWAEMLHHPCILGDPQRHGGQNQNWWGPQVGGNATSPLHSRGSPKDVGNKIRFGGAHKWLEMLHHPCILGDPQRHGGQNQNWWGPQVGRNATSPLHSRGSPKAWGTKSELVGPTSGWKCYITPAFSGVTKDMGDKIRIGGAHKWAEMLHHPCILGGHQRHVGQNETWWGPQVGGNATSPLHSPGSPKTWRTKSELVGPTSGRKRYITPAFSRIPQRRGEQNQIWWGPQVVGNATSPLHSRGSPKTWWTKSELVGPTSGQKCYITPAFAGVPKGMGNKIRIGGAHKWLEMLHHPRILGGHQRHGEQNQNWWGPQVGRNATSPLHSRGSPGPWGAKSELVGPTSGRKCYITPAFSGIPKNMGDKIRIGCAHKWAEMLNYPCILGGPQRHGEQNQNWWGPQVVGNATSPLHSRGAPKDMGDKIRIGGAHKWAEMLHHPCILGDPQRHGEQNQNWWGPQVGGNATSPLHSRESPKTWGTKSKLVGPTSERKCYITPAFSGIPKDMGNKIRIGVAHK